jgi:hypothetical protein
MKSYHISKHTKAYTENTVGLTEDYHHIGNFDNLEQFHTHLEIATLKLCEGNDSLILQITCAMPLNVPTFGEVKETEKIEAMVWLWCQQWQMRIELDFQVRQALLS